MFIHRDVLITAGQEALPPQLVTALPTGWAFLDRRRAAGFTIRWKRGDPVTYVLSGQRVGDHGMSEVLDTLPVLPEDWTNLADVRQLWPRSGCLGILPIDLRQFGTAGKQPVEENIQALGDLHREPYLPTCGADFDRNTKHQRGMTITLCEPRTTGRTPLAVVAVIASHQRLRLR